MFERGVIKRVKRFLISQFRLNDGKMYLKIRRKDDCPDQTQITFAIIPDNSGHFSFARRDFMPAEFMSFFINKNEALDFIPGTKSNYSNTGYFMLGYIIEKVSGMPYEKYIEENIFRPAGMLHSYFNDYTRIIKNRVKCYDRYENGLKNAEYLSPKIIYSAGALMTTVEDFNKYYKVLNSYTLVFPRPRCSFRHIYKLWKLYGQGFFRMAACSFNS
jgi:hypothetical protein